MMVSRVFSVFGFWLGLNGLASAMPWGMLAEGYIGIDEGKPALCVPRTALGDFVVGYAYIADVENRIKKWAVESKAGADPVFLAPGFCITYGFESPSFDLIPMGPLEERKKYFFRVDSFEAARTRTEVFSYSAAFCVRSRPDGGYDYVRVGLNKVDKCK